MGLRAFLLALTSLQACCGGQYSYPIQLIGCDFLLRGACHCAIDMAQGIPASPNLTAQCGGHLSPHAFADGQPLLKCSLAEQETRTGKA